ncbi:hypothetical protein D3C78_1703120 [compost metagenome]
MIVFFKVLLAGLLSVSPAATVTRTALSIAAGSMALAWNFKLTSACAAKAGKVHINLSAAGLQEPPGKVQLSALYSMFAGIGTSSLAPAAALPLMPLLDTLTVKSTTAPL